MPNGKNKAVFLDRDGTINQDRGYLYRKEEFEYLDGAIEGLKRLSDAGFILVIITNQSGIAKGYYTEKDYLALDKWLRQDLLNRGVRLAGSYYCPHLPNAKMQEYAKQCSCRKPGTGLFWQAQREHDIDMNRSFAVGDKERDLSICKESRMKGILLSASETDRKDLTVCKDWRSIVEAISEMSKSNG